MSTQADESAPPALYEHAITVYNAMLERSTMVEPSDGSREMCVYEGRLTDLVTRELYMSTPYYTKVTRLLKALGSIRQLKRGGGSSPSQWEMITTPTIEKFMALAEVEPSATGTTGSPQNRYALREDYVRQEQRLRDLSKQFEEYNQKLDIILKHVGTEES